MAHLRCDFRSEMLQMGTSMTVFLPEAINTEDANVVYLLHGLEDNCTGWTRYTSVERYARAYNLVVVIPEVQRSFYTDMEYGLKYFSFVHDELPQICRRMFHITTKPEKTYIMGLSMGGYGTLKCMLRSPSRYAGCAAFSSATDIKNSVATVGEPRHSEYKAIFGENLKVGKKDDLYELLKGSKNKKFPRIYMACGEQDSHFDENQRFVDALKAKGIPCTWEHFAGDHNWVFWDKVICKAFDLFFA